jgi:peptidoglycan/LPS O-acetylase OafA/YrhL
MEKQGDRHFLFLDGMRGVAAIFVGLTHASIILTNYTLKLPNAHLAVDFFFCLSGFVVAYAYADRLRGGMPKSSFFLRRLIRLGPLLFLGLTLGAVVLITDQALSGSRLDVARAIVISALSFLMIPGGFIYGHVAYPTNNPVWSLFFEIWANVFFCVVTIRSCRTAFTLTLGSAALLALTAWHFHSILFLGFAHPDFFLGGFARVAFPFAAGCLIYRLGLFEKRRLIWSWTAFLAVPLLLGFPAGNWKSDLIVVVIIVPLLVVAGTATAQATAAPFLRWLGELSYPFYVIHEPILRALGEAKPMKVLSVVSPLSAISVGIIVPACTAILVSRLYDVPLRRYLTDRFSGQSRPLAAHQSGHMDVPEPGSAVQRPALFGGTLV